MILDRLASYSAERVKKAKEQIPLSEIKNAAYGLNAGDFEFEKALSKKGISFICEVKKASPSKGIIDPEFNFLEIAGEYESGGADCISCLTEPKWFLGSDDIFRSIRKRVSIPMIRKDFTVDEYQLYEAKCMGADAVLLICALLDTDALKKYIKICDGLGISVLTEAHSAGEIDSAVNAGARIIGVNNRNLKDFSVNINNTAYLRGLVPAGTLFVAESGIQKPEDMAALRGLEVDAVLVGEALMRAENKKALISAFREAMI